MTGKRVSYTLDSTLESVNHAEETAGKIATTAGFGPEEVHQITMAVREAAVNAVLHGNAYDPSKKVRIAFERNGDSLIVTVQDEGGGLDASLIPDPLAPGNLLKQSGRGIFLIKAFMDEVHIRNLDPGTEITLIKRLRGSSAGEKESSK